MLQGFEWELPADGLHWRRVEARAFDLRRLGVTAVWLPPAAKGAAGTKDVGYGVYDLYDLGEFKQKGSVRTKYGTKAEYIRAIRALHAAQLQALADVVLNHRIGGDEAEEVEVQVENSEWRGEVIEERKAKLYTRFICKGRGNAYSDFQWDATCFTGTDWDAEQKQHGLFLIKGKQWAEDVDREHGNYDYLMGVDVDVCSPKVREELARWGVWLIDETGCDGFRLDAVKHISAGFYRDWLPAVRMVTGRELFAVGEYWHRDVSTLIDYLYKVQDDMSLFDVPLHFHLHEASCSNGEYDMRGLFEGTLTNERPRQAVTFVDNHDTQPGQALESWVGGWFKAAAYGLILLRSSGYPCVFWGDLYGIPASQVDAVPELPMLMQCRRLNAYGEEHDYFDDADIVGFTREGDKHPASGLAFLCTNRVGGEKRMYAGKHHAGQRFVCLIGRQESVKIDPEGYGVFTVADGGTSLYVPKAEKGEKVRLIWHEAREQIGIAVREWKWRFMKNRNIQRHEHAISGQKTNIRK